MIDVISVRFRSGSKIYYFDPHNMLVRTGDDVIVETSQGLEFARCIYGNHAVEDNQVIQPLRPLVRVATDNDRHTAEYNRRREEDAFQVCQKKIAQHGLEMKLVRVECSFDGSKILFFFTADGRVDFRELVKDLAGVFRSRIELRQIGVRDEAKMLGGLGICGRPFCCCSFMDDFVPVSIKMAKTQSLSLNPAKISGTCGRLMCCLKYEQEAYEDAIKRMPKNDSFVLTPDGPGNVSDINVLKEKVNVRLDDHPEAPRCYHNCEVCVLRNGKGSRDGIEIPQERPERYVEERSDEPEIPDLFAEYGIPDAPAARSESGEKRRDRRDRRRGGRKSGARAEGGQNKPAEDKRPGAKNEGKPEGRPDSKGEGKSGERRDRRRRKPAPKSEAPAQQNGQQNGQAKSGSGKNGGEKRRQNPPKADRHTENTAAPRPQQPGGTPAGEGGEKRKRPHHRRGGRRHSSGAPKTGTPKSEN